MKARSAAIRVSDPGLRCAPSGLQLRVSMPAAAAAQIEVDVLLAGESKQLLDAFLAPDAGLLEAAERRAEEMLGDVVDPDVARLHGGGGAVRGQEVIGPDRAGE